MTDPPPESSESAVFRIWSWLVIGFALVLFFLGGALGNFGSLERWMPEEGIAIPATISPDGELAAPPSEFRWEPGDVHALGQVLVYDKGLHRIWESAPMAGRSSVEIPLEAFHGINARDNCLWRVREVTRGKPRASSPFAEFWFLVDSRGYGPGEAPPYDAPLID